MKRILILLLLSFAFDSSYSQTPVFKWAQRTGSYNTQVSDADANTADMKLDRFGHLYTVGEFNGTVDFDPGAGIDTLTGYSNYLTKADTAGNHLWTKKLFGGHIQRMAVDTSGNIFFTGFFSAATDMDPGPGVFTLVPDGSSTDLFVCKLDSAGNFLWAIGLGDSGEDWGKSLCTDKQGNIYVTGHINGIPDMDPGPAVHTLTCLNDDAFILKLAANGDYIWAKNVTGLSDEHGRDIAVDTSGNVYVTGSYLGTADFDPGPANYNLISPSGSKNAFLLKLNSSGDFVWAKNFGDFNDDWGDNVTVDMNGNVVFSGFFSSVMDCDPGPGTFTLTPSYYYDFFAVKLTSAGGFMWARKFGQAATSYSYLIPAIRHTLDANGNVYFTGNFKDTADFNPGPGVKELTTIWDPNTSTYDYGAFLLLLDSSGNYRWAAEFEHGGQGNWGTGIQVDRDFNIYASGDFNDTIDFDPGAGVFLLQNPEAPFGGYGFSAYMLKIGQCFPTSSNLTLTNICKQYTVNNHTYSQSGTYTQTLTNAAGCDSILTLHLTITVPDTLVTQNGNSLSAQAASGTYQWIDCSTMTAIAGANQQQFSPSADGSYAMIITQGGCSDTSACHQFVLTGVGAIPAPETGIVIGPNPFTTELTVTGSRLSKAVICNMEGSALMTFELQGKDEAILHLNSFVPGVYLLRVTDATGRVFFRTVIRK